MSAPAKRKSGKGEACLSTGDVQKLAGVNAGTFHMWLDRGFISCDSVKAGGRTFRRFTKRQAVEIAATAALNKLQIPIGACAVVAKDLVETIRVMHGEDGDRFEFAPYLMVTWEDANTIQTSGIYDLSELPDEFAKTGDAACILVDIRALDRRLSDFLDAINCITAAH